MAIYHLSAQIIGKGGGRSAVAAAAYRHCAKMERSETGEEIDYSRKGGNAHSEFALPENAPDWIADYAAACSVEETSAYFWNQVEAGENRIDAQLMREFVLALPIELTTEQNIELVRDFVARELSAHGIVADWAYHDIADNPHVHLMTSLRPLTDDGFGTKRVPVLGDDGAPDRGSDGKIRYKQFTGGMERLIQIRAAWAEVQNQHLAKHGHDIRVDHRSFEDLGIDAVPTKHRGPAADAMDARGAPSELVDKAKLAARENYQRFAEDPNLVLQKITVQRAVFTRHDIAREIHRTECSMEEFQALFYRVGALEELVPVAAPAFDAFTGEETSEALFSTQAMVDLEHSMVSSIEAIATTQRVAIPDAALAKVFTRFEVDRGFELTDQQKAVVRYLTNATGAGALVGYAGAGKSTTIAAVRTAFEGQGNRVVGGALAGIAADNLRSEAGVESRTLASWEYQWAKGDMLPDHKTVFIMDEAGMVSSRQMENITQVLRNHGARMIVLGDVRQLQPIEAGAAFRAFVDVTGYTELDQVVRQSEPWMRQAAIAFGSGRSVEGVEAYLNQGCLNWTETSEDARAALIQDWLPAYRAGLDASVMAHRNKDVIALNGDIRDALKARDALGEEHPFMTERGEKSFAQGDRILFLKNERSLGVFNGSTGTVQAGGRNRLEVQVDDHAEPIVLRANTYNHIDHGYARTIHKEQGNTVDRSFVYLSPTMDAQLSYVALTRHREDVTLYGSVEACRSRAELRDMMVRDRLQDSTALYRDTVDCRDALRGFAERRGVPTSRMIVTQIKANLHYLRRRFDHIASAFSRLTRPAPSREYRAVKQRIKPAPQSLRPAAAAPEISAGLNRALVRLAHTQPNDRDLGRRAVNFGKSAYYELNVAPTAAELRQFSDDMSSVLPRDVILNQGVTVPEDLSVLHTGLDDNWSNHLSENWRALHALAMAETRVERGVLLADLIDPGDSTGSDVPAKSEETKAMPTPSNLIEGYGDIPDIAAADLRQRAADADAMRPSLATARDIAGRIYATPDAVVDHVVARFTKSGNDEALVSEIERLPAEFGDLHGATLFGIANAQRRSALEQAPMFARHMGKHFETMERVGTDILDVERDQGTERLKPLVDLSPKAIAFLDRAEKVTGMPSGAEKVEAGRQLLTDRTSLKEVSGFRQALSARYGRGHGDIRSGIAQDPSLKGASSERRKLVEARVDTVLTGFRTLVNVQEQVKYHDRSRGLEKGKSRGIER